MGKTRKAPRTPEELLDALAGVARKAADRHPSPYTRPEEVTQQLWNGASLTELDRFGSLPEAHEMERQLSHQLGRRLGWRLSLQMALSRPIHPGTDDGQA